MKSLFRADDRRNVLEPWYHPERLKWLGLLGLVGTFVDSLRFFRFFYLFFALALLAAILRFLASRKTNGSVEDEPSTHDLPPLPPSAGSPARFALRLGFSQLLSFLNPFQIGQGIAQIVGQIVAARRPGENEPSPGTYVQQVEYDPPFSGEWYVANGGVTADTSHSWDILAQRYAYDFVRVDVEGKSWRESGSGPADYFAYGEPILAPADGLIVTTRDGVRDAPRPGTGMMDWLCSDIRGNYVVIRHAPGEYSLLAHLIPGSIMVREGEAVRRGETIGRCGNSGHSSEPHLHFHVQDGPSFYRSAGLPVQFSRVVVDGIEMPEATYLQRESRVAPIAGKKNDNAR